MLLIGVPIGVRGVSRVRSSDEENGESSISK